jgi:Pentapeptide repeats (8 copies)
VVTSAVALGALVFTGLSLQQTRVQNGIAEQGEITSRYSAAIDQLGSATLDVRLGGIYALERIMHDSAADQPTIVEVLSAFVREHAAGVAAKASDSVSAHKPPADIGAALDVLGRRDAARDGQSAEDLEGADLAGYYLANIDLDDAALYDADLTGAELADATLVGTSASHAIFKGADIWRVLLGGADLSDADLTDAVLDLTDLEKVDLTDAHLAGAHQDGAAMCAGSKPTRPDLGYVCTRP